MLKKILSFTSITSMALVLSMNHALAIRIGGSHYSSEPDYVDYFTFGVVGVGAVLFLLNLGVIFFASSQSEKNCPECGQPKPITQKVIDCGKNVPAKR